MRDETSEANSCAPSAPAAASEGLSEQEADALFAESFAPHRGVVLAVSGGGDSLAMLVLAAEWARCSGYRGVSVATVDHGLRPEAQGEIAAVAKLSRELGLSHARLPAPVTRETRIEETARDLRIVTLAAHSATVSASAFATAHTLDDQAETVLMRLAAGSGPSGLAGMASVVDRQGVVQLRPLLGVRKSRLIATLQSRGVPWATDVMNADPAYARARLRASGAALAREGLTAERLARFARRMARVNAALDAATEAAAREHLTVNPDFCAIAPQAASLPNEIRLRLLARAISGLGDGAVRLERLERLAERLASQPRGAATLGGARIAWDEDGRITVTREGPRAPRGGPGRAGL